MIAPTGSLQGTNALVLPLAGGNDGLADQGLFHVALESTPGVTGIIGPVSTTLDETKAIFSVYNSSMANVIVPKYLRLHVFTIGTGGTRVHFTGSTDTINRYSSGGSALAVANTNTAVPASTAPQIYFGALSTTASSPSRKYVLNKTFKATTIETAEDTYQFSWGAPGQLEDPASLSNVAAALSNVSFAWGPLEIGPGHSFVIHQWRASITVGITFGVEFGFILK